MIATRLIAPALALVLGMAALSAPTPAKANDDLIRVLVDVADVVMRGDQAYYRHGRYSQNDRLVAVRDRHGRVSYYRHVPRQYRRSAPPHGVAHGYYRNASSRANCNSNGKCKVTYYDPRKDKKRNSRNRRGW